MKFECRLQSTSSAPPKPLGPWRVQPQKTYSNYSSWARCTRAIIRLPHEAPGRPHLRSSLAATEFTPPHGTPPWGPPGGPLGQGLAPGPGARAWGPGSGPGLGGLGAPGPDPGPGPRPRAPGPGLGAPPAPGPKLRALGPGPGPGPRARAPAPLCEWVRASMTLSFTPIQRRYRERNRAQVKKYKSRAGWLWVKT